jgi:hypothetical protein
MRIVLLVLILSVLVVTGCAGKKAADHAFSAQPYAGASVAPGSTSASSQPPVVAPETPLVGRVVLVNPTAQFVVLNFPIGRMALVDQRLDLYRKGIKVGEVRVSGPQRQANIVADLVAGKAEVDDEARSQ